MVYPVGRHDLIQPLLEYLAQQMPPQFRWWGKTPSGRNRQLSGPDDPLLRERTGFYGRIKEVDCVVEFLNSNDSLGMVTAASDFYNVEGGAGHRQNGSM